MSIFQNNAHNDRHQDCNQDNGRTIATGPRSRFWTARCFVIAHSILLRAAADGFVPLSLFLVVPAH
jgi:hypothetical protein